MKSYFTYLPAFGVPEEIQNLVSGKWKVPASWEWVHPRKRMNYPFLLPPALLPFNFQSHHDAVLGIWKHWLIPERRVTYVDLYFDGPFHVTEVARNPLQLVTLEMIRNRLGLAEDKAGLALLKHFGQTIDLFPEEEYEDLSANHPIFTGDWPLGVIGPSEGYETLYGDMPYTGDFPRYRGRGRDQVQWYKKHYPRKRLKQCCGLEIAYFESMRETFKKYCKSVSPWLLADEEQPEVFQMLMTKKNYAGAWMSLNSASWTPEQAIPAIEQLADAVEDSLFQTFVSCWVNENKNAECGF